MQFQVVSKKSNTSKRYTAECKRDAVALVHSSGKTVTEVARQIGVTTTGTWAVCTTTASSTGGQPMTTCTRRYAACRSPTCKAH
ncbi:transposase [Streptomyces pseudogriseolus]|uniref:transposase n=1 Tax=Streptomyces pseudogriseolus TaxID=36817 RepID=UPI00349A6CB8